MDKNPFSIKVRLVEYKEGSFKGKDNETIQYNTAMIRFGGNVVKMTAKVDLAKFIDKDVIVSVEMVAGNNLMPKLRIVGVEDK